MEWTILVDYSQHMAIVDWPLADNAELDGLVDDGTTSNLQHLDMFLDMMEWNVVHAKKCWKMLLLLLRRLVERTWVEHDI